MPRPSNLQRELARIGAKARIKELSDEIEAIRREFPGEFGLRAGKKTGKDSVRKRSRMSASARAAVSKRMKAYWAARRKEKKA